MTIRQFSSTPVTLLVAGTPAPPPCLPARRPPHRLDAGSVSAALARTATRQWRPPTVEERQLPHKAAEFLLAELYQAYDSTVLRTALRAVEPGAGPDVLWEREADGPDGLDGVLAELGRSLAYGPRVRAVLVDRPGTARRLFVGIAAGPLARALGVLEELRSALAHPPSPVTVPTSALQRELLRNVIGRTDHGGRHVEQLSWNWHGPLDTERFTAAWQSVFDHELVLRAAFDWTEDEHDDPWIVLHGRAVPEVTRHPDGAPGWDELLAADRRRGFDLRRRPPPTVRCSPRCWRRAHPSPWWPPPAPASPPTRSPASARPRPPHWSFSSPTAPTSPTSRPPSPAPEHTASAPLHANGPGGRVAAPGPWTDFFVSS